MSRGWIKCTELYVPASYPAQECRPPNGALISTYDNVPPLTVPYPVAGTPFTPFTVPDIAEDARAVFLCGMLIISNATGQEPSSPPVNADMRIYFRTPGGTPEPSPTLSAYDYPGQADTAGFAGERSGLSCWVGVVNRVFEFAWIRSPPDGHPLVAYGFKFYVNAWCR